MRPLQMNVNLNVKCFPGTAPSVHDWAVFGADCKDLAPGICKQPLLLIGINYFCISVIQPDTKINGE